MATMKEHYVGLENTVMQRLKWAAGANPTLQTLIKQLTEALAENNKTIQHEIDLANELINMSNAMLHFEAQNTTSPESASADANFLVLLSRCEESTLLIESCGTSVSEWEKSIMQLHPVPDDGIITAEWVQASQEKLLGQERLVAEKTGQIETLTASAREVVKQEATSIRNSLATHHELMSDVRSILKSMAKYEEIEGSPSDEGQSISGYLSAYKTFSEDFTTMLKLVLGEQLTSESCSQLNTMIETLKQQMIPVYDELVKFAPTLSTDKGDKSDTESSDYFSAASKKTDETPTTILGKKSQTSLKTGDLSSLILPGSQGFTPKAQESSSKKQEKVTRDPRTGKAVQARNTYAVGVWRRVKMKLDGRDPDTNHRLSAAEQVDFTIKEATSLENLACLYEGWTPWV